MKYKKYIIPLLIICLFTIHTLFMLYEYTNYNGFDVFRLKNMVSCKFIVCTGDLTTWISHEPTVADYRIYMLIGLIAAIMSFIDYMTRRQVVSLVVLALWTILFILNTVPMIVLSVQKYGLTWMLYYEGFITMQFLNIKNLILSISYIIYLAIFIIYTVTSIRYLLKKTSINIDI